ncbi:MAG TPA: YihY/virulence factor BrkB family protein [Magnetospirillum sp.]|jgi:membrane protein|nr:YihY/virulence factor BrkB family protein [Magnetospirillum sp.]
MAGILQSRHGHDRGRSADRPQDIPAAGWWDIVKRVWADVNHDEVSVISAGIAFDEFFALFPALAAGISLYGLIADPGQVEKLLGIMGGFMPGDVTQLVGDQLHGLISASGGALGLSLFVSLAIALWKATQGVKGMIAGLNIVYGEEEKRGFVSLNTTALSLTLGAIIFGLVALTLVAAVPPILDLLPVDELIKSVLSALRWPLLAVFVLIGLSVVYRFGPSRDQARWHWVTWGAAVATIVWLVGSGLFSLYASRFANFNKTYGSMAAVAVTLLWFQLTSFAALLGALLDAEMEHQTARDTTTGPERPMGQRGARMADTLGQGGDRKS